MANKFNMLLHGELDEVQYILDQESCDEQELRAALQNVIRNFKRLENVVDELQADKERRDALKKSPKRG